MAVGIIFHILVSDLGLRYQYTPSLSIEHVPGVVGPSNLELSYWKVFEGMRKPSASLKHTQAHLTPNPAPLPFSPAEGGQICGQVDDSFDCCVLA